MNKKLTGPASSARVLGLSQKHMTKTNLREVSEHELQQCQGSARPIIIIVA